jgi:hypothetical protein
MIESLSVSNVTRNGSRVKSLPTAENSICTPGVSSLVPFAQTRRGSYAIEVEELDRIELDLGAISSDSLPVGSTLKDGVFYWQLGPGFLGDYEFRFTRPDGTWALLHVKVRPKSYTRN